jgi:hypothetical protein
MKTQHLVPRPADLTVEHVSVRDFVRPMGVTPPVNPTRSLLELVRESDENATDGHTCTEDVRQVWYLCPVDRASILHGEPTWRIATWCRSCRADALLDGYCLVPTEWTVGGAA